MFAYIKGKLTFKNNEYMVIECSGIGYKIHTAMSTLGSIGYNEEIKVFTHLHVREDDMSLYGFITQEELNMFELLLSVSGVGPKAAISLVSAVPSTKFCLAVIGEDAKTLTLAQGIGNKMAQRIILELKDKINKQKLSQIDGVSFEEVPNAGKSSKASEAVGALMVLGYTAVEANRAIASIYSEQMEIEDIIKGALKALAK